MSSPVRLGNSTMKESPENGIETWILNHSNIFLPLLFIVLFILFACLIFAVAGASVESGNYYYHLKDVI